MSELVTDRTYRRFIETEPDLPAIASDKTKMKTPPWVVYVQKDEFGKWGSKSYWKYSKALKFMHKALRYGVWDVAISCRRMGFNPPERLVKIKGKFVEGSDGKMRQATKYLPWKPKIDTATVEEHHWCKYCRRPTVFKWYSKHGRLGVVDSTVPRCCICGASARISLTSDDKFFRVT